MYTLIQQYERALEADRQRELAKECQWRETAEERLDKASPKSNGRSNNWWSLVIAFLAGATVIFR
jgi:hypothetical protein